MECDGKSGGDAAKAPGEDRGRCSAAVAASLLLLPLDGGLVTLFSLFDVFKAAFNPASLAPPGGDRALLLLRVDVFPLLSALSCCE